MNIKRTTFLALAATATISNGAVTIQELFDAAPLDATINGWGGSATAIGQTGNWATNGSVGQNTANNFNVNGATLPGRPSNDGAQGGFYNGTASFNTNIYATRQLSTSVNFGVNQEIFFSVRLRNNGDTSMGVGLASGVNVEDEFVGAGFSWDNYIGGSGNAAYITHGNLNTPNGSGGYIGVYGQQVAEAASSVNGYGLLVGRITINAVGNDFIDIKRYAENSIIDPTAASVTWSAQSAVDSSMSASHLLVWMNGNGSGELDAIRFGETWADVTGVPEPSSTALLALGGLVLAFRRRK